LAPNSFARFHVDAVDIDNDKVKATYLEASEWFTNYLSASDAYLSFQIDFARKLAKRFEALNESREVFELLAKNYSKVAMHWLAYAQLESELGNYDTARTIYKRACNTVTDWPEQVFEQWLAFERDHGSIEQWFDANHRIVSKKREAFERSCKELAEKRAEREQKQQQRKPRKRPAQDDDAAAATTEAQPRKRQRTNDATKHDANTTATAPDNGSGGAVEEKPPAFTVHVGNLPYGCNDKELRTFFEGHVSGIKSVRLPLKENGKIKGFAFIDFDSEAAGA